MATGKFRFMLQLSVEIECVRGLSAARCTNRIF